MTISPAATSEPQDPVAGSSTAPASQSTDPGAGRGLSSVLRRTVQGQGLFLMLIVLCAVMSQQTEFFFTWTNFFTIGGVVSALGIMAVAQTFLIISGGFDVSVGSVVALTGTIIGLMASAGYNVWLAAALGMLVGLLAGVVNGVIVVLLDVNPLIATLGTLSIFTGLAFTLTEGNTFIVSDGGFAELGSGYLGPVPIAFLIFIAVVLVGLFFERLTVTGRRVYAIGGNAEAARLSGVRVTLIPFMLYVVSGISAGAAGVLVTSQLGAASPQVGSTFLLSVVTAVILGGASLSGGRGTVVGTLIAVFVLGVLQNGFALLGLSSDIQTTALGVALIVAVLLDRASNRLSST